jgi:hypothetical protein
VFTEAYRGARPMNVYQKLTILLTAALLPLLLLYMRGMGYAGVWLVGVVTIGVAGAVFYALRNARAE